MSDPVVGIDLGTSNSVVTVVLEGDPIVITDPNENRVHPSLVHFEDDGTTMVGAPAEEYRIQDPAHTVYSIKRLIGRPFDDPDVKVMMGSYPYPIHEAEDGSPRVEMYDQSYPPEAISGLILRYLKGLAQDYLGQEIEQAIITVPANFDEAQRRATKRAAEVAGLDVPRLVNEPTAAALAYGYDSGKRERIAIYDFGGGTFDISILELRGNVFEVVSTAGNSYLGGDDMDYRLVSMMLQAFERQHGYDLSDDETVQQRLKAVAKQIKHQLTDKREVQAKVTEYVPGGVTELDLEFTLTRDAFNDRCEDIVDESLDTCKSALEAAGVQRAEVDHLVMVGGSTRVPLVQKKVQDFFGQKPVLNINPDEVVSIGAAVFGSTLAEKRGAPDMPDKERAAKREQKQRQQQQNQPQSPQQGQQESDGFEVESGEEMELDVPDGEEIGGGGETGGGGPQTLAGDAIEPVDEQPVDEPGPGDAAMDDQPLLIDVTPHALGVATVGGVMDIIIEQNASLPLERSRTFSTSEDNQTRVVLPVYAGNSRRVEDNRELGALELEDIPPRPREDVEIRVTFSIDTDGMLSVRAVDTKTGRQQSAELSILGDDMEADELRDLEDHEDLATA